MQRLVFTDIEDRHGLRPYHEMKDEFDARYCAVFGELLYRIDETRPTEEDASKLYCAVIEICGKVIDDHFGADADMPRRTLREGYTRYFHGCAELVDLAERAEKSYLRKEGRK